MKQFLFFFLLIFTGTSKAQIVKPGEYIATLSRDPDFYAHVIYHSSIFKPAAPLPKYPITKKYNVLIMGSKGVVASTRVNGSTDTLFLYQSADSVLLSMLAGHGIKYILQMPFVQHSHDGIGYIDGPYTKPDIKKLFVNDKGEYALGKDTTNGYQDLVDRNRALQMIVDSLQKENDFLFEYFTRAVDIIEQIRYTKIGHIEIRDKKLFHNAVRRYYKRYKY